MSLEGDPHSGRVGGAQGRDREGHRARLDWTLAGLRGWGVGAPCRAPGDTRGPQRRGHCSGVWHGGVYTGLWPRASRDPLSFILAKPHLPTGRRVPEGAEASEKLKGLGSHVHPHPPSAPGTSLHRAPRAHRPISQMRTRRGGERVMQPARGGLGADPVLCSQRGLSVAWL